MNSDHVNKELFAQWRDARRATSHAQVMTNPVWEWLVRCRLDAYNASKQIQGTESIPEAPRWCCLRMGQSETRLPDGRTILIAGEHEDHYDPDFYIYNDVIIRGPDDSIEIFGYPPQDFAPTDFHSASLISGNIVLVGNLGYPALREFGTTQVCVLDLDSMRIRHLDSSGEVPGWISSHTAETHGTDIIIRGGTFYEEQTCENIDEWKLDTNDWQWQRLTNLDWTRIEFFRADKTPNDLWRIGQLAYHELNEKKKGFTNPIEPLTHKVDFDLFQGRYRPAVNHEVLPNADDEFGVYRIRIEDTVIRFNEDCYCVTMTVEGAVCDATLSALIEELQSKLSTIENTAWSHRLLKNR